LFVCLDALLRAIIADTRKAWKPLQPKCHHMRVWHGEEHYAMDAMTGLSGSGTTGR